MPSVGLKSSNRWMFDKNVFEPLYTLYIQRIYNVCTRIYGVYKAYIYGVYTVCIQCVHTAYIHRSLNATHAVYTTYMYR